MSPWPLLDIAFIGPILQTLFFKLGKIEGASTQLRGTLFEYLAADIVRKTISWDIEMNRIFKNDTNKKQAEVDVVAINGNASIHLIECKGYGPYGEIPDSEFKRWLQHKVPTAFGATNDLGLTTVVPARSTIYADTCPRTIEIEANAGDAKTTKPVIYISDFKRISRKDRFLGRPAMRVSQAIHWFRDERSNLETVVDGIVRYLARNPHRQPIVEDLRENIHAIPAWIYQAVETITSDLPPPEDGGTPLGHDAKDERAPGFH